MKNANWQIATLLRSAYGLRLHDRVGIAVGDDPGCDHCLPVACS